MKTERKSQDKEQARPPRPRPALWVRLFVALLSPVVFLVALEVVLRIAGYGQPEGFFIRWDCAGQTVHLTNRRYGEHFVPKERSRAPESIAVGEKAASTVRVFVLGGSAAFGDPDPAYGFCRQLEVLLNAHSQAVSFEVINAAVTSMNSHVARRIAPDCAALKPDVFVVYMGNNEVVGPYGPPTLPAVLYGSRAFINLSISARKQSRLGQLMSNSIQSLRASAKPERKWLGMEAFLSSRMVRDDERVKSCYGHFRDNLNDIIETAHARGAATILCTVPTNIRSCPPFGSAHQEGLTEAQATAWERLFAEGRALERAGDFATALARYEQTRKIDEKHAELAFCMARCLHALDKPAEANRLFVEARDLDTLRFRADSPINRAIREVALGAADRGVTLCDLEAYLQERSRDHLVGDDLLADHVHLNFRGSLLAACAALEAIGQAVPRAQLSAPAASEAELLARCRNRLLYDDSEAYRLGMVMYRRKTLPPFKGQIDHDGELARLRRDLVAVYSYIRGKSAPESWYVDAVAQAPLDPYLSVRYGEYLLKSGRIGDAVRSYQKVLAAQPYSTKIRAALAQALAQGGMPNEAATVLADNQAPNPQGPREALLLLGTHYVTNGKISEAAIVYQQLNEMDPDNLDVLVNLAAAASHAGDFDAMKRYLDRALRMAPESAQAMINMGNYHAKMNQPEKAQTWFAKAVATDPQDYLAHIGLGIQSIRLGQIDKGMKHVREAVVLKPDFREGYAILATACEELGRADEARKYADLRDLFEPTAGR
jgi:tetratricopeptide (TPR) repeat protein